MAEDLSARYLTTRELAELLRVKERKVYELATAGAVPFTRVTGKLLFPRHLVEAWLARHTEAAGDLAAQPDPPPVAAGGHDPLLDWAIRESRSGIATFFDGSFDGIERFARREALLSGLHVSEDGGRDWNSGTVARRLPMQPVVLVEWARRERGLIVPAGNPMAILGIEDLEGRRVVPRQAESASQRMLAGMLADAGLAEADLSCTAPARSEHDVAIAVLNGRADAGLGIAAVAQGYRLGFVPLVTERFDLLVWRRGWFEPAVRTLMDFCAGRQFRETAAELGGYDVSGFGRVRYNGP